MRELERATFTAMGTACALAVTPDRSERTAARLALSAAWRELRTCERILSRFDARSQLSELNRNAGTWWRVDERLIDALRTAVRLRSETAGLFDPTILPALLAQGYDRSFELLEPRAASCERCGRPVRRSKLDPVNGSARIERGAAVDLGGIGKGFAAARALGCDASKRGRGSRARWSTSAATSR